MVLSLFGTFPSAALPCTPVIGALAVLLVVGVELELVVEEGGLAFFSFAKT